MIHTWVCQLGLVSLEIISSSQVAFQAQPMILYNGLCTAVITVYYSISILKLNWHGLALDGTIQIPKCRFHIGDSLAAYGTSI